MNFLSCVDRNLAVNVHHPLHTKWLNQPLDFSYKSGDLCPHNRMNNGRDVFLCAIQNYETMEHLFWPKVLSMFPLQKNSAYKFITPEKR